MNTLYDNCMTLTSYYKMNVFCSRGCFNGFNVTKVELLLELQLLYSPSCPYVGPYVQKISWANSLKANKRKTIASNLRDSLDNFE